MGRGVRGGGGGSWRPSTCGVVPLPRARTVFRVVFLVFSRKFQVGKDAASYEVRIFLWLHVQLSAADTPADNKFTRFAHFGMMKTLFPKLFTIVYSLRSLRFSSLTLLTLGRCAAMCPDNF